MLDMKKFNKTRIFALSSFSERDYLIANNIAQYLCKKFLSLGQACKVNNIEYDKGLTTITKDIISKLQQETHHIFIFVDSGILYDERNIILTKKIKAQFQITATLIVKEITVKNLKKITLAQYDYIYISNKISNKDMVEKAFSTVTQTQLISISEYPHIYTQNVLQHYFELYMDHIPISKKYLVVIVYNTFDISNMYDYDIANNKLSLGINAGEIAKNNKRHTLIYCNSNKSYLDVNLQAFHTGFAATNNNIGCTTFPEFAENTEFIYALLWICKTMDTILLVPSHYGRYHRKIVDNIPRENIYLYDCPKDKFASTDQSTNVASIIKNHGLFNIRDLFTSVKKQQKPLLQDYKSATETIGDHIHTVSTNNNYTPA